MLGLNRGVLMIVSRIYKEDLNKIFDVVPKIEELKNKKILITGASGLICSTIVDFLINLCDVKKFDVRIYIAARSEKRIRERFGEVFRENVYYLNYDAEKPIEFDIDVDYIIHGAGNANPRLYFDQPVETMTGNFIGILNLLQYANKHNTKRVLYISSSEVYGEKDKSEPYCEDDYGFVDILSSRSSYPSAKRASETLCVAYGKEFGVDSVIVRPGHVYGPSAIRTDNRVSTLFAQYASEGKDIVLKSSGKQIRSYCYVVDCASAILTVLCNGISGEAYNISNKNSIISIRQLAELCCEVGGIKLIIERPSEEELSVFNPMDNASLSSSKLERLGWTGIFDAQTGIAHTIRILRDSKNERI